MKPSQISLVILRLCGLMLLCYSFFGLLEPNSLSAKATVSFGGLAGFALVTFLLAVFVLPALRDFLAGLAVRIGSEDRPLRFRIAPVGLAGALLLVALEEGSKPLANAFFPTIFHVPAWPRDPLTFFVPYFWGRFLVNLAVAMPFIWGPGTGTFAVSSLRRTRWLAPAPQAPGVPLPEVARILWRIVAMWVLLQAVFFALPFLQLFREARSAGGRMDWGWNLFPLYAECAAWIGVGVGLLALERNWSHLLLGPSGGVSRSPNRLAWAGLGLIIIVRQLNRIGQLGLGIVRMTAQGLAPLFWTHLNLWGEAMQFLELGLGLYLAFGLPGSRGHSEGFRADLASDPDPN